MAAQAAGGAWTLDGVAVPGNLRRMVWTCWSHRKGSKVRPDPGYGVSGSVNCALTPVDVVSSPPERVAWQYSTQWGSKKHLGTAANKNTDTHRVSRRLTVGENNHQRLF